MNKINIFNIFKDDFRVIINNLAQKEDVKIDNKKLDIYSRTL